MNNSKNNTIKIILESLHKFLFRASLTFSIASLIIAIVSAKQKMGINGVGYINFAYFSVLLATSFLITDLLKKHIQNAVITGTVNFLLCYLSFSVLFLLMKDMIAATSFNSPVASFIFLSIAFVAIYFIAAIIKVIAGKIKKSLLSEDAEYKSIYK